ncbi:Xpo1-domain-containing protein, partial [Aureobasidium melanogenum]
SEENDQSADAVFTSQLYLFEAVGAIASTTSVPLENRMLYARTLVSPLIADLERHIPAAKNGDERAIIQVHHIIQAIGTLAKGFCDWMPGNTSGAPPPSELANEFSPAGEAVLAALESLKNSMLIRTGARFAFSRMLGVLGSGILQKLPRWIDGLLAQSSTKDEMATFLRLLDQVVFGFKAEIIEILDQLLTPLLQRVLAGLSEPTTGTDDAIQLGELKMQYLQFILVILNNDLAP